MKSTSISLFFLLFIVFYQTAIGQMAQDDAPPLALEVRQNGIFYVSGYDLAKAGWNLSSLNKKNIRLTLHGKEIPIFWKTDEITPFQQSDTLLFYGKQNEGVLDSLLYRSKQRANPFVSVFKEANYYYLTHSTTQVGKRIVTTQYTPTSPVVTSTTAIQRDLYVFDESYSTNATNGLVPLLQQSTWEEGEGWSGVPRSADSTNKGIFTLTHQPLSSDSIYVSIRLAGRSRVWHELQIQLANQIQKITISPFGYQDVSFRIPSGTIEHQKIQWEITSTQNQALDWFSISFIEAQYTYSLLDLPLPINHQKLHVKENEFYTFTIPQTYQLWDVTNEDSPVILAHSISNQSILFFSSKGKNSTLFLSKNLVHPIAIRPLECIKIPQTKINYLFITSKNLVTKVTEYAAYRATDEGGSYKPFVVTTEQIRDTYGFGETTPWMIQKALQELSSILAEDTHVFLVGRGMSFPGKWTEAKQENLVPTYGYPASDILLTSYIEDLNAPFPHYPIGRLSITLEEELENYLNKVKEYEREHQSLYLQKKVLHLSGGRSNLEREQLKNLLQKVAETTKEGIISPVFHVKSKVSNLEVEKVHIGDELQDGVGMITFLGHGASSYLDFDIGLASNPSNQINNKGKYPFIFFNGCGVGNIFNRRETLTTDWLLAKDKGAIAILAHSFWSYLGPTETYLKSLYEIIFNTETHRDPTIGQIQRNVYLHLLNQAQTDAYLHANIQQIILQGDPALILFKKEKPDLSVNSPSIYIQAANLTEPIANNDSISIIVPIQNRARYSENTTYDVRVISKGKRDEIYLATFHLPSHNDTLTLSIATQNKPTHLHIEINPAKTISEYTYENNNATLKLPDFDLYSQFTTYPETFGIDKTPPLLLFMSSHKYLHAIDTLQTTAPLLLKLIDNEPLTLKNEQEMMQAYVQSCKSCPAIHLPLVYLKRISTHEIIFNYDLTVFQEGTYTFLAQGKDEQGNYSSFLENTFYLRKPKHAHVHISPNPFTTYIRATWDIATDTPTGTIEVIDIQGKIVFSKEVDLQKREYIIDTNKWITGTYIFHLRWKDEYNNWQTKQVSLRCMP